MEDGEEEELMGRGSWYKELFYCFSCFSDFFSPLISHSDFKLPISSFCLSHSLSPSFLSLFHSVSLHLSLSLSFFPSLSSSSLFKKNYAKKMRIKFNSSCHCDMTILHFVENFKKSEWIWFNIKKIKFLKLWFSPQLITFILLFNLRERVSFHRVKIKFR